MLPTSFLRQLIGMYGEEMQSLVPRYLEQAMAAFARQQEKVQETVRHLMPPGLTGAMPGGLEEVGRQNLAMMERAMSLFSPFYRLPTQDANGGAAATAADDIGQLRAEVERLRDELLMERAKVAKLEKYRASR